MSILTYSLIIFAIVFFVIQAIFAKSVKKQQCKKCNTYPRFEEVLETSKTESGKKLEELDPYIIVFLRHFGCTFCKEMLNNISTYISKAPNQLTSNLVFVHMINNEDARKELSKYKLESAELISDSDLNIYRAFGLPMGKFYQLFSLRVWVKSLYLTVFKKHSLIGKARGDVFQMPGVFYIRNSKVVASFQPEFASEAFNLSSFSKTVKDQNEIKQ